MRNYKATPWMPTTEQPPLMPPGAEMETTAPARPAEVGSDLLVPAGQAVVTGGLVASLVVFLFKEVAGMEGNLFELWAGITLAVAAATWILLLMDTRRLLWAVERLTGQDLDGDGETGEPGRRTLEVELKTGRSTMYVDAAWLEIDDDQLLAFAEGLVKGRGLAEGEWGKNRTAFPRGVNEYRAFRTRLLEAGLIALVNPNAPSQGYSLTPSGRAVFRRLEEHAHTRTRTNGQ